MVLFLSLTVMTTAYFIMASVQDIRERMIYTAPVIVLHAAWSIYLATVTDWGNMFLCGYWIVNLIIYILLNKFQIWGGGDSDLFLLSADLCLAAGPVVSAYTIAVRECMCLAAGLALAAGIGYVEAEVKGEKMEGSREMAVVPGMAVVMTAFIMKGFVWRLMQ